MIVPGEEDEDEVTEPVPILPILLPKGLEVVKLFDTPAEAPPPTPTSERLERGFSMQNNRETS
ncbi:unnamed protein product [Schistosoma margrebowiei]|uniref:Uncharacterized protein n=1 Tax=Schistosoma margrebowiei TaxID=48269 RepID=A0A3P7ZPR0_9TREM|nr:unnamed protein product [Schistosoma margrebowiei]